MTIAEQLVQDVERMVREGKPTEEIMSYTDEIIWRWNKETLTQMRLQKLMDGVMS